MIIKLKNLSTYVGVAVILVVVAFVSGWVINLVKLFRVDECGGEVFARLFGAVVAPIGGILGWF